MSKLDLKVCHTVWLSSLGTESSLSVSCILTGGTLGMLARYSQLQMSLAGIWEQQPQF